MSHAKLRICAAFKLHQPQGILPLRRPHVGALHVVLVGSRPDHLGIDLLQIEDLLHVGSLVCGNFGGASLEAIQTRKKLAALTVVTSAPEGADAARRRRPAPQLSDEVSVASVGAVAPPPTLPRGSAAAHIFAGSQLEVRRVILVSL